MAVYQKITAQGYKSLNGNAPYSNIYAISQANPNILQFYTAEINGALSVFPYLSILKMIQGNIPAQFITGVANTGTVSLNVTAGVLTATAMGFGTGTVTSVATAGLISGGAITTSGTITTSMNTGKLVGRGSSGVGIMEEITISTGLTLTGTVLTATGSGGTITAVSIATANGFSGTSSGGATPALTIAATPTGILKSNGTAISAATAADITGQLITGYVSGAGVITASDTILTAIDKLNGNTAALVTGVSSVSGTTNRITVSPTTGAVVVNISASYVGQASIITVGTLTTGAIGAGFTAIANSALANSAVTINGSSVSLGGSITVTATASNALTIGTGLSGASYNGSAPVTIANTGVLSNVAGTGISVSGATGNVTITNTLPDQTVVLNAGVGIGISGTYPTFTITNNSPSSGGTVTSIATTAPITGGTISTTGTIGITQATTSTNGYLSSTDWNTFNSKQATISVTTPITLTGASVGMVNQGTTTTVLHGNAAGNPTFAAVNLNADVTGTWTDWSASVAPTGFSATSTVVSFYQRVGKILFFLVRIIGTSNATTFTVTLPVAAKATSPTTQGNMLIYVSDAGVDLTGEATATQGSTTLSFFKNVAGQAFTNSGVKAAIGMLTIMTD